MTKLNIPSTSFDIPPPPRPRPAPPLRYVVKGWGFYREFDTREEAEHYQAYASRRIGLAFAVAVGFLLAVLFYIVLG